MPLRGTSFTDIALKSIENQKSIFAPLKALTTDFSEDVRDYGGAVVTRMPTNKAARKGSAYYLAADDNADTTAVTVTLNQVAQFALSFSDMDRDDTPLDLARLFMDPGIKSIGDAVLADIYALLTTDNFATEPTAGVKNLSPQEIARENLVANRKKLGVAKAQSIYRAEMKKLGLM